MDHQTQQFCQFISRLCQTMKYHFFLGLLCSHLTKSVFGNSIRNFLPMLKRLSEIEGWRHLIILNFDISSDESLSSHLETLSSLNLRNGSLISFETELSFFRNDSLNPSQIGILVLQKLSNNFIKTLLSKNVRCSRNNTCVYQMCLLLHDQPFRWQETR